MENVTKLVSIHELIATLNRDGAAVYVAGMTIPIVACWVGEQGGYLWYHLGDVPHWGPKLADMKLEGDALIGEDGGGNVFMITTIRNAPELRLRAARDQVGNERAIMTRERAITMLGDTPGA